MEKLTFLDKLKSWKRWMVALAVTIPFFIQLYTSQVGWPMTVGLTVAALCVGVVGLAAEDSARLLSVAASLIGAITKKPVPDKIPDAPSVPEDVK